MKRRWMQLRDLWAMRAHGGRAHYLLSRLRNWPGIGGLAGRAISRMERFTDERSLEFDRRHGTETRERRDVDVGDQAPGVRWGYSGISEDFFHEILGSISLPLNSYHFVDVGSGKGAAILHAGRYPFARLVGIELTPELIEIARRNVERFNASTKADLRPDWINKDFFRWGIPADPQYFFFNNPFPESISVDAIAHIEASHRTSPRPLLLAFRKAPGNVGRYLHESSFWRPLRLAPYWRLYRSPEGP